MLFYLGGCLYVGLELLWRQRSHWSMFLAGGTCFVLLGQLRRLRLPLTLRACIGAGAITLVELGTGLLVNRSYAVWDYRGQPWNLWGQICPPFTLLWIPVALTAMWLHGVLGRCLDKAGSPGYDLENPGPTEIS